MPAKLLVVMGKGGVGKTTLSAGLALAHAHAGKRVALASLTGKGELEGLLATGWGTPPETLRLLALEPRQIVDELVGKMLPIPGLAPLLAAHPAYDAVYRIAPGIKEVAVLHRLLAQLDSGAFDLVVVDGLATGHGTHFLEAPRKGARILTGTLADRAREIDAALTDPARTRVLLATTPEEMPVRETLELAALLRQGAFPLEGILVNRVVPRLFPSKGALAVLEILERRSEASAVGSDLGAPWGLVRRMARAAGHLERRAREMEPLLDDLKGLGLHLVTVPLLPSEEGRLRIVGAKLQEAAL